MAQVMTLNVLKAQNCQFAGTQGVSQGNRRQGFIPGFLDKETGRMYVSCKADGSPVPFHLLDGLPDELILSRSPSGQVVAIKGTVIAGFIRCGCFYTREQAANVPL